MTIRTSWLRFAAALLILIGHTPTSRSDDGAWLPSPAEIRDLEQHLTSGPSQPSPSQPSYEKLTAESLKISARYYYGAFFEGTKVIKGEILRGHDEKSGVFIKSEMPIIMDGGCSVINFLYDPKLHRFMQFECNGFA